MCRILSRIIVILLALCLIVNPDLAAVPYCQTLSDSVRYASICNFQNVFNQKAIEPPLVAARGFGINTPNTVIQAEVVISRQSSDRGEPANWGRRAFVANGLALGVLGFLGARNAVAAPDNEGKILELLMRDLKELPAGSQIIFKQKCVEALGSSEIREAIAHNDHGKVVQLLDLISETLLSERYCVFFYSEIKWPKLRGGDVYRRPEISYRAALLHLQPSPTKRSFAGNFAATYNVDRVAGYLRGMKGQLSFPGVSNVYLYDGNIAVLAESIKTLRHSPNNPKALTQLKNFVDFDDPVSREIVLETFRDVPDDQVEETLREQVINEELIRVWCREFSMNKEKATYLASAAISKKPWFYLLRLVHRLQVAEDEGQFGLWLTLSPEAKGINDAIEDLITVLLRSKLPFESLLYFKSTYESLSISQKALVFIRILRTGNISEKVLQEALKTTFERQFGRLPERDILADRQQPITRTRREIYRAFLGPFIGIMGRLVPRRPSDSKGVLLISEAA